MLEPAQMYIFSFFPSSFNGQNIAVNISGESQLACFLWLREVGMRFQETEAGEAKPCQAGELGK